ncbi:alpha/beta hydrolase [Gordonia terrae]|uniref:Esterase family protein n=2 Tax=Gordonia terrae TaxID=2055 RepID=A0AAD0NWS6_9ACTN|nr:alpha/beta hydrolase family protein [Gordonia terrae]VTR09026.1 esterase [Clostridioides difficile]ANY21733.1 esterase [Gordonia terrae]AWO82465.1 esterase family protein [Gordonia terrae]VTS19950.1 Mycolyl transferase 85A [Gordonia terrae]GAB44935.1 putative mycolyltransferase [Gordonia terrae NBRC 100016]
MSRRLIAGLVCLMAGILLTPAIADAAPKQVARIAKSEKLSALRTDIWVFSPAMNERIKLSVLTPVGGSAPRSTVYMLDGAGAEGAVSDWITKGRAGRFFADKNVNVVLPTGGKGTFYTDWQKKDAALGKPMWETFLTKELPPLIDERFDGNGRNAVIGLSMGGQAAFSLAIRHPEMYTGVASLSGCPPVSGPVNEAYVRGTVGRDGGDATNMWGPFGSAGWRAHDPSLHLDRLRGKNIFISAGSGAVGPLDLQRQIDPEEGPREVVTASSSALELGAYRCSLEFAITLRAAGVRYTDGFRLIGTHTWAYWERDLEVLWPTIGRGL